MKKDEKSNEIIDKDGYIHVNLGIPLKNKVKKRSRKEGSNMTVWVRQLIMRELDKKPIYDKDKSDDSTEQNRD